MGFMLMVPKIFISPMGIISARILYNSVGIINTFAGNGTAGFSGDGGQATMAEIHSPSGVSGDASGNIYITDGSNNRIRER